MTVTRLSLWDAEDEPDPPKVRDMFVGPVSTSDVDEFCQRYHYTGTGGNRNWRWGLWGPGEVLWGVVAYNLPTRSVCSSVFGPDHLHRVWHMGRLVLPDHAPRNSESRLIAGSLRLIQENHPSVWGVLTYAAQAQNHIGYIYQATNAIYTGTSALKPAYVDERGQRRASYLDGSWVGPERAAELGWERVASDVNHRYLYVLGDRRQRKARLSQVRLPMLETYPKLNGEAA